MKTSTVILIVAAGAAVLFIATRSSAPRLPVGAKPPANSAGLGALGSFFGGLVSTGGGALSSLFGGGSSSSSSSGPSVPADFDTNNFSVSNGFMYTDAGGNFIAG